MIRGIETSYGVCDSPEQFLSKFGGILDSAVRRFVVSLTPVWRANQPCEGGWRWHKWGPYVGDHDPQHEYLYDDEGSRWVKHLVWRGKVKVVRCIDHSFAWSGRIPCTGIYRCIYCGYPHPTKQRRL